MYIGHDLRQCVSAMVLAVLATAICQAGEEAKGPRTPFSAARVISALASKNPRPTIVDGRVEFPKDFQWMEQERCWKDIQEIAGNAEQALPELISHLKDDRYCITVHHELFDVNYNWTIGDVCHQLITRTLADSYYHELEPETVELYRKLRRFGLDRNALVKWCDERKGMKLYELQLEACNWALERVEDKQYLSEVTPDQRSQWLRSIKAAREKISKARKAVPMKNFGPEELRPSSNPFESTDPFAD